MTSIIKLVDDANKKLHADRKKAADEFEAAVECLWVLHVESKIDANDALTRDLAHAFNQRASSGGKTGIAGCVQTFFRNNENYLPVTLLQPLHEALKSLYNTHEDVYTRSMKEWESVVTFEVLCAYNYENNKNHTCLHDDEVY